MKKKNDDTPSSSRAEAAAALRRQAEEKLSAGKPGTGSAAPADAERMLHELRVHQIELETQNEELRLAQADLEASRTRYFDLYDLAPVGYVTLSDHGLILEANLTTATLLGVPRALLARQSITRFIRKEDEDLYYLHRKKLIETGQRQVCRLRMLGATDFWAHMEAVAAAGPDGAPVFHVAISDISESKHAEEALGRSEDLLQDVGHIAQIGGWEMDLVTRKAQWTRATYELIGIAPGTPPPGPDEHVQYYVEEDRPRVAAAMRALIEDDRPLDFEARADIPGKGVRWFRALGRAVRENGRCVRVIGTLQDITERKRAEEAVHLSHERLRRFVDSNIVGVIIGNPAGAILDANDYYLRLIGFTREEFLRGEVNWRAITPPEWIEVDEKAIAELRERGTCTPYEKEYLRRDGTRVPVLLSDAMLPGPDQEIVAFVFDLSERKRAEESLRKSESRLASVFRAAPIGIGVVSNRILMEVNQRIVEMTGYSREELLGQSARILYPDDAEFERVGQEKYSQIRQFGTGTVETRWKRKDGSILDITLSSAPIDPRDLPAGVTFTALDITERRRTEVRAQLARDVLEQLNRSGHTEDTIRSILQMIKKSAGVDAAGIRLRTGDDFPYFAEHGFSPDFLLTESTLIKREPDGSVCRDKDGRISLECTCGLVLSGRTDPTHPLFTEGGSFWVNDSLPLLDLPRDQDPRQNPRNRCIHEGYRSFALIPLRSGDAIIGLLQLNHRQPNQFTPEIIRFYEGLGSSIGIVLMRKQAEEAVRESEESLRAVFDGARDSIFIKDRDLRYTRVNTGMAALFETRAEDLLGKTDADLFGAGNAAHIEEVDRRVLNGETVEETPQKPVRGVMRHFHTIKVPLHNDQNEIVGLCGIARDITDIKLAEEALRDSRERYRLLTENTPDIIWQLGLDLRFTYLNATVQGLIGYTAGELIGRPLSDICAAERQQQIQEITARELAHLETHTGVVFETELLHRNGQAVPVEIHGTILKDANGKAMAFQGVTRDISERKQAEKALRASQQLIEGVINTIPARVFWKDKNLVYLGCNSIFARDAGFSEPKDIVGKDDYQMGWRDQAELYRGDDRRVIESGRPRLLIEEPQTTPDGRTITLLTSKIPLRNSEGDIIGVLGTYLDISARKQAEESLRQSEGKFSKAFLSNPAALIISCVEDGRIVDVNDAFLRTYGCAREEAIGRTGVELNLYVDPHDSQRLREKPSVHFEMQFRTRSGEIRNALVSTERIQVGGVECILSMSVDVTELKRVETALRESQAQLADTIGFLPDAVLAIDRNKRVITWNRAIEEMTGVPASEMVGQGDYAYTVPFYGERRPSLTDLVFLESADVAKRYPSIVREGDIISAEAFCHALYAGKGAWVYARAAPLHDDAGNVVGAIEIIRDITERKHAEALLQESYAKYESIFQATGTATLIVEADTTIVMANRECLAATGYTPEELIRTKWPRYVAPDSLEEMMRLHALRRETPGAAPRKYEAKLINKKGEIRNAILDITVIPGTQQSVVSMLDITERRRAEQALSDEATRRRILIEQSSDGIVVLDHEGKVYEANKRYAEMLGYSPEEVLQLHVWDWDMQWSREQLIQMIEGIDEAGAHFETRHRRKDGSVFEVEVSTNGALCAGQKLIFCVCRDTSARKRAEEQLNRQLDELRRWHEVTLGREERVTELKREVNDVLAKLGQPTRYGEVKGA